jgi:hypothetical protein
VWLLCAACFACSLLTTSAGISRDALLAWALHQQEEQRAKKEQLEQKKQQQKDSNRT